MFTRKRESALYAGSSQERRRRGQRRTVFGLSGEVEEKLGKEKPAASQPASPLRLEMEDGKKDKAVSAEQTEAAKAPAVAKEGGGNRALILMTLSGQ